MPVLPSSLALTSIADGSNVVAADHRNNYAAIQTETNALLGILDDGVAGQFLKGVGTTVSYDYPPGYEYSHVEATADVSVTATTQATANTAVTAAAVTVSGADIVLVTVCCASLQKGTTYIRPVLFEDGVAIKDLGYSTQAAAPFMVAFRRTPAAGSRTFSLRGFVDAGTGFFAATGLAPMFIRVTKV